MIAQLIELNPEYAEPLRRVVIDGVTITHVAVELGLTANTATVRASQKLATPPCRPAPHAPRCSRSRVHQDSTRMNEPRRHHYVPQGLLRRFADANERLRAVHRDGSGSFVASVRNLAVETDFYAVQTDDGTSQAIERELSKLESDALAAIVGMVDGAFPPRDEDRLKVSYFVALQWQRGRNMRDGWHASEEGLYRFILRMTPNAGYHRVFQERHGRDATEAEIESLRATIAAPSALELIPNQNRSIGLMLETLDGLAQTASHRRWYLVRAPQDRFLTSDAPVVLAMQPGYPAGFGIGFGTADEIRISLDRRHALVLLWESERSESILNATDAFVADQNRRTAGNGYRWYFQHPQDPPLAGGTLPPPRAPFTPRGPSG